MDLRLGPNSRARIIPRPQEGFRVGIGQAIDQVMDQVMDQMKGQAKDHAPRAEAAAVRCVERTRPVWSWFALEWRRLGTAGALILIAILLLHAMFGANGMVVYRQKRSEMQSLQSEVDRLQKENDLHADQIRSLKSDPAAIEKEAREQLRYVKPGEYIYVSPDASQKPPSGRARNDQPEQK
jgi:cell division protein FtsB